MNYGQIDGVRRVLRDVETERFRQYDKWGEQSWPFGGSVDATPAGKKLRYQLELRAKAQVQDGDDRGDLTWEDILLEEFCEAAAAETEVDLERELIQVAGVACAIVEDIRRRRLVRHIEAYKDSVSAQILDPRCSA